MTSEITVKDKDSNISLLPLLNDLKLHCDILASNYSKKITTLQKRNEVNQRLDVKLNQLEQIQNGLVEIKSSEEEDYENYSEPIEHILTTRETILNCQFENTLQDMIKDANTSVIYVDYPYSIVFALLEIIRKFQNNSSNQNVKVFIELDKNEIDIFPFILNKFFKDEDVKVIKKKIKYKIKATIGQYYDEAETEFSPLLKEKTKLQLLDNNRTVKHIGSSAHASVLGKNVYSSGVIGWRMRINHPGDTPWIVFGIFEASEMTTYGDYQSDQRGINVRGADYDANNMDPKRCPKFNHGDIVKCILDFDKDKFTIEGEKSSFKMTSTKSLKGKSWRIYVELYYKDSSITLLDLD